MMALGASLALVVAFALHRRRRAAAGVGVGMDELSAGSHLSPASADDDRAVALYGDEKEEFDESASSDSLCASYGSVSSPAVVHRRARAAGQRPFVR